MPFPIGCFIKIYLHRVKQTRKSSVLQCSDVSGPVVWYQDFEYAISHWLQKAAEHVYGCVLCSPGCFSLFRGSSLMDDNVMRRYVVLADSPAEHVQFDQGVYRIQLVMCIAIMRIRL